MNDKIRDKIRKNWESKEQKKPATFTLSPKILKELDNECKRLKITSKSYLVENILYTYFRLPEMFDDNKMEEKK